MYFLFSLPVLPDGLFKTLLRLWDILRSTYITVYEWMGNTAFNGDFSVLNSIFGIGIFVVLAYILVKWFMPI